MIKISFLKIDNNYQQKNQSGYTFQQTQYNENSTFLKFQLFGPVGPVLTVPIRLIRLISQKSYVGTLSFPPGWYI